MLITILLHGCVNIYTQTYSGFVLRSSQNQKLVRTKNNDPTICLISIFNPKQDSTEEKENHNMTTIL